MNVHYACMIVIMIMQRIMTCYMHINLSLLTFVVMWNWSGSGNLELNHFELELELLKNNYKKRNWNWMKRNCKELERNWSGIGIDWKELTPALVSTLFLNIFKLLAIPQSIDNLFHSFIVLSENEYFLISNLHWSCTNFTSCPLVLLSFLSEKKHISVNIFIPIQYLKKINLISS